jgi:hypothetical protein
MVSGDAVPANRNGTAVPNGTVETRQARQLAKPRNQGGSAISLHRADHIAIAKAIRDTDSTPEQQRSIATALAKVCAERTPKGATFDRELFLAYALSPVLTGTEQ